MQLFADKGDFSNKKRPKRDQKSGLGLLRDLGLPKRDLVGSSAVYSLEPVYRYRCTVHMLRCACVQCTDVPQCKCTGVQCTCKGVH